MVDGVHGMDGLHARKIVEAEHIPEIDTVPVLVLQEGEIHVLEMHRKPKLVELTDVMVCIWHIIV